MALPNNDLSNLKLVGSEVVVEWLRDQNQQRARKVTAMSSVSPGTVGSEVVVELPEPTTSQESDCQRLVHYLMRETRINIQSYAKGLPKTVVTQAIEELQYKLKTQQMQPVVRPRVRGRVILLKQCLEKSELMAETPAMSSVSPGALIDRNTETSVHNSRETTVRTTLTATSTTRPYKQMDDAAFENGKQIKTFNDKTSEVSSMLELPNAISREDRDTESSGKNIKEKLDHDVEPQGDTSREAELDVKREEIQGQVDTNTDENKDGKRVNSDQTFASRRMSGRRRASLNYRNIQAEELLSAAKPQVDKDRIQELVAKKLHKLLRQEKKKLEARLRQSRYRAKKRALELTDKDKLYSLYSSVSEPASSVPSAVITSVASAAVASVASAAVASVVSAAVASVASAAVASVPSAAVASAPSAAVASVPSAVASVVSAAVPSVASAAVASVPSAAVASVPSAAVASVPSAAVAASDHEAIQGCPRTKTTRVEPHENVLDKPSQQDKADAYEEIIARSLTNSSKVNTLKSSKIQSDFREGAQSSRRLNTALNYKDVQAGNNVNIPKYKLEASATSCPGKNGIKRLTKLQRLTLSKKLRGEKRRICMQLYDKQQYYMQQYDKQQYDMRRKSRSTPEQHRFKLNELALNEPARSTQTGSVLGQGIGTKAVKVKTNKTVYVTTGKEDLCEAVAKTIIQEIQSKTASVDTDLQHADVQLDNVQHDHVQHDSSTAHVHSSERESITRSQGCGIAAKRRPSVLDFYDVLFVCHEPATNISESTKKQSQKRGVYKKKEKMSEKQKKEKWKCQNVGNGIHIRLVSSGKSTDQVGDEIELDSTSEPAGVNRSDHKCPQCDKRFRQIHVLERHMITHTGEKPHTCSQCGKRYTLADSLQTHMRTHAGEKLHTCSQCGKRYTLAGALQTHMRTHAGERNHTCSKCGKCFARRTNFERHMKTHTRLDTCPQCGEQFTQAKRFKIHMRTHTSEKTYKCFQCGKQFTEADGLKTHMMTHTVQQGHTCPPCGELFTAQPDFMMHMHTQHTVKHLYRCPVCSSEYKVLGTLAAHILTHTEDRPHQCSQCGREFITARCLRKHMRRTKTGKCAKTKQSDMTAEITSGSCHHGDPQTDACSPQSPGITECQGRDVNSALSSSAVDETSLLNADNSNKTNVDGVKPNTVNMKTIEAGPETSLSLNGQTDSISITDLEIMSQLANSYRVDQLGDAAGLPCTKEFTVDDFFDAIIVPY